MLDWTDDLRPDALDSGSGAPSGDPGVKWARYLDTATGDVYTWDGADWVKTGALPVGGGGGGSAGTEYTEDAAAAANPVGGALILVRRDTLSTSEVSADGDNIAGKATSKGEQYVKDTDLATITGGVTESAPGTDTASSGLNGRLQRIAQRLTSLIALLPASLGAGGGLKVDGSGTALPVSSTTLATSAKQDTAQTTLEAIDGHVDGLESAIGTTAGAAVITDTTGTLQQYLRGLVKMVAAIISVNVNNWPSATTWTVYDSAALEASKVVKSSAGSLKLLTVYNSGPGQWFALKDATSVPANGALVGKEVLYVPALGTGTWDYGESGQAFATGIVVYNSTTDPSATKTLGAADCLYHAEYL